jgi:hypothetical protein
VIGVGTGDITISWDNSIQIAPVNTSTE